MGTTADKLQKLVEGKQAIVNAVNSKANASLTINSKLSDIASTINDISSGVNLLQKKIDSKNATGLFAYWPETNLDEYINSLDFSNVTDMRYMFNNCINLTSIPQLNTSKVNNMYYMFSNCSKLTSVPQLDTSNVTNIYSLFHSCSALESIDITYYNFFTSSYHYSFAYGCTALKSLIIRSFGKDYVLNSNSFNNSGIAKGTGYIYVPRNMVDTLKSATNWSTYASQIRALEDYTVDGTTSGALDETKI